MMIRAAELMETLSEEERQSLLDTAVAAGGNEWDLELYLESYWQLPVTSDTITKFRWSFNEWLKAEVSK